MDERDKGKQTPSPPSFRLGPMDLKMYTVKRPILKSSLMRQIAPLEYINTLLKRSIPKKPR
jgi:hypothetical protein